MEELNLNDILNRPNRRLLQVSIYLNGFWRFTSLTNPIRIYEGRSFYRIDYPFGLVKEDTVSPDLVSVRGVAGDYVAEDLNGYLSLITAQQYKELFEIPQNIAVKQPVNQRSLSDKFIVNNSYKNTTKPAYNTTVASVDARPTTKITCNCN
jgi:hypothetical protein